MKKDNVSRRDFGKLALAAFGGVVAGSVLGGSLLSADEMKKEAAKADAHACCGLNACKGQGKGGDNDCAGQGKCSTTEAHGCAGRQRLQEPGRRGHQRLQGTGELHGAHQGRRLEEGARQTTRPSMTKAGKKFGPPPRAAARSFLVLST